VLIIGSAGWGPCGLFGSVRSSGPASDMKGSNLVEQPDKQGRPNAPSSIGPPESPITHMPGIPFVTGHQGWDGTPEEGQIQSASGADRPSNLGERVGRRRRRSATRSDVPRSQRKRRQVSKVLFRSAKVVVLSGRAADRFQPKAGRRCRASRPMEGHASVCSTPWRKMEAVFSATTRKRNSCSSGGGGLIRARLGTLNLHRASKKPRGTPGDAPGFATGLSSVPAPKPASKRIERAGVSSGKEGSEARPRVTALEAGRLRLRAPRPSRATTIRICRTISRGDTILPFLD